MSVKHFITNQKLSENFDNSFTLVNFAIAMAKTMIYRGEGLETNVANRILENIIDRKEVPPSAYKYGEITYSDEELAADE